jgi:hypothetical protein
MLLSFPFAAGVESGTRDITHERKPKSQAMATIHLKDRRAVPYLAAVGYDVFPSVLLDR